MKTESKNTFKVLTFTLLVFALLLINDRNAHAVESQFSGPETAESQLRDLNS